MALQPIWGLVRDIYKRWIPLAKDFHSHGTIHQNQEIPVSHLPSLLDLAMDCAKLGKDLGGDGYQGLLNVPVANISSHA